MSIEIRVPNLPESVSSATVASWHKKAGERVSREENLVDLETDKVMLEVPATADGVLKEVRLATGATVKATIANRSRLVERPISWGEKVWLSWSPDAGVVLTS